MEDAVERARARFGLPPGTSSDALRRALAATIAAREETRGVEDARGARADASPRARDDARAPRARDADEAKFSSRVDAILAGARARETAEGGDDDAARAASGCARASGDEGAGARERELESLASAAREDARMARRRASALKLECRARDGKIKELEEELARARARERAARHERVAETIRATTTRDETGKGVGKVPVDASAALAQCWHALGERANDGNAPRDVLLLMREYKRARRERTRAFERIAELEDELARMREEMLAMERRERETLRTRATAEAIIDEEADEKLTLQQRLKEALEERAALLVHAETQRDAMDEMRKVERHLRDENVRLEKELIRGRSIRDKLRASLRNLEDAERESAERGERLALVEAECEILAGMIREMRVASGASGDEFMRAAERALLFGHQTSEQPPSTTDERSDVESIEEEEDDGFGTPDEEPIAREYGDSLADDLDFPSPPISAISRGFDAPLTPGSDGSTAFNF